ncbi:hypothetical protein ILYODFUR_031076 [Ilyodon furcidens]|uniref:Uncharacterized protein n=1 Tax=Ilyodon furcidens TaxID=33524 RepID=A0ABV0TCG3_9TELE
MADNEKLDNQRLKNFKNKGRDLEVKVVQIGVSAYGWRCRRHRCCVHGQRLPLGSAVTSFLIPTHLEICCVNPARAFTCNPVKTTGLGWVVNPVWVFGYVTPAHRAAC